ncbi:LPS export ABC transporter periplasmic protein LptC [Rickettsiales bacterium]|nr:LPS export ABC transporter periplasmic protein LptC [Rickettsiales bacterium]
MPTFKDVKKRFLDSIIAKYHLILQMMQEPISGHSRVVVVIKAVLLFGAIVLLLVLSIFPMVNSVHDQYRLTFSHVEQVEKNGEKQTQMLNPRFQGIDEDGQPYNVTADIAIRDKNDKLYLHNINADMTLKDGTWLSLLSSQAKFSPEEKVLDVSGAVSLFTARGYELATESVHIDLKNQKVIGNEMVQCQGPVGTIKADRFSVLGNGDVINFSGNVKIKLYPASK